MTENLAGRGEGLAGLVAKLDAILDTHPQTPESATAGYARLLGEIAVALAALEAAAPPTRNRSYLEDLKHDLRDESYAYEYLLACAQDSTEALRIGVRDVLLAATADDDDECSARDNKYQCTLPKEHAGPHKAHGFERVLHEWAALATPSPQAPAHAEDCECACYYRGEFDEREYQKRAALAAPLDMKPANRSLAEKAADDEYSRVCPTCGEGYNLPTCDLCHVATVPAATQEQPAGSGHVDILAELDHEKYTGPAGKLMHPSSPRKVGEDGPVTRETLEHWLRVVKSTLDPDGWDCGAPELRRMREQLEALLARSSSVPVGEQK